MRGKTRRKPLPHIGLRQHAIRAGYHLISSRLPSSSRLVSSALMHNKADETHDRGWVYSEDSGCEVADIRVGSNVPMDRISRVARPPSPSERVWGPRQGTAASNGSGSGGAARGRRGRAPMKENAAAGGRGYPTRSSVRSSAAAFLFAADRAVIPAANRRTPSSDCFKAARWL